MISRHKKDNLENAFIPLAMSNLKYNQKLVTYINYPKLYLRFCFKNKTINIKEYTPQGKNKSLNPKMQDWQRLIIIENYHMNFSLKIDIIS